MKANGLQSTFCLLHVRRNLGSKNEPEKNLSSSLFSIDGYGGKIVHITPEWLLLKNLKKKPSTRFWPLLEDYERKNFSPNSMEK